MKRQPAKVYPAFILRSMSAGAMGHFFLHVKLVKGFYLKVLFLFTNAEIHLDQKSEAFDFSLQQRNLSQHGNKVCHRAFSVPRDLPPLLSVVFDQFDSFKQNTALCVFRANFPLHRWRISVYFSFIFNGRPFRHWTHEPLFLLHILVCRCTLVL